MVLKIPLPLLVQFNMCASCFLSHCELNAQANIHCQNEISSLMYEVCDFLEKSNEVVEAVSVMSFLKNIIQCCSVNERLLSKSLFGRTDYITKLCLMPNYSVFCCCH